MTFATGTSAFTTPVIPFADFADFNPGHGTDTVAQNIKYFRDEYGATRVRRVNAPTGIAFRVVGPVDAIARLSKLHG